MIDNPAERPATMQTGVVTTSKTSQSPFGAPNFNRLARPYRWLEYFSFGPCLWRCRIHFLSHLSASRSALVLGDGDGRFTARLLRANPTIRVTAVDVSPRMIASLMQAAEPHLDPQLTRLTTHVADIRTWTPTAASSYDLIVTHFFLDCLTTPEIVSLAGRLTRALAPNALWLVSEFAIPPTRFGRLVAAPLVGLLYRAFRALTGLRVRTLPDFSQSLLGAGWRLREQDARLRGLLVSQLWQRGPDPRSDRDSARE